MATILKFNNIVMPSPAPDGFKISHSKIWSKDTGRTQSGEMVGTILAIKKNVDITWGVLTPDQAKTIDDVVSNSSTPFNTVEYVDEKGETTSITGYFSDIEFPIHTIINGKPMIVGATMSVVEK